MMSLILPPKAPALSMSSSLVPWKAIVDALSVPEMSSDPASSTLVVVLAPLSVQLPPASTASAWKLANAVPTEPITCSARELQRVRGASGNDIAKEHRARVYDQTICGRAGEINRIGRAGNRAGIRHRASTTSEEHPKRMASDRSGRIVRHDAATGKLDAGATCPARADTAAVRNRSGRPVFDIHAGARSGNGSTRRIRYHAAKSKDYAVIGGTRDAPVIGNAAETAFDEGTEFLTRDVPGRLVRDGAVVLEIDARALRARSENIAGIGYGSGRILHEDARNLPRDGPQAAFETLPPASIKMPLSNAEMAPAFATLPVAAWMNIPAPAPPVFEMVAPAAFMTLPPANSATPSSAVVAMLPKFEMVPAALKMKIAPPAIVPRRG